MLTITTKSPVEFVEQAVSNMSLEQRTSMNLRNIENKKVSSAILKIPLLARYTSISAKEGYNYRTLVSVHNFDGEGIPQRRIASEKDSLQRTNSDQYQIIITENKDEDSLSPKKVTLFVRNFSQDYDGKSRLHEDYFMAVNSCHKNDMLARSSIEAVLKENLLSMVFDARSYINQREKNEFTQDVRIVFPADASYVYREVIDKTLVNFQKEDI